MLLNIILGFLIPWLLGALLYLKDRQLVLLIAPFSSMVSFEINSIGFNLGFWSLSPREYHSMAALPYNLGLYAICGTCFVYSLKWSGIKPYSALFSFSFLTTILEYLAILLNFVTYGNGWNIFLTFFSYLAAYILVYIYYKLLHTELGLL